MNWKLITHVYFDVLTFIFPNDLYVQLYLYRYLTKTHYNASRDADTYIKLLTPLSMDGQSNIFLAGISFNI